jgi:hypothetical protein
MEELLTLLNVAARVRHLGQEKRARINARQLYRVKMALPLMDKRVFAIVFPIIVEHFVTLSCVT